MPDPQPSQDGSLLRMRGRSPEQTTTLANRLLDPAYIRRVLTEAAQKRRLERAIEDALKIPTPPKSPLVPRKELSPYEPVPKQRSGEFGDVVDALMGVPAVAQAVDRIKERASDEFKLNWRRLSTGGKAALITQSALIAGGTLTGVLASKSGRREAYNLIKDRQVSVPIPFVPGLKMQVKTGQEHRIDLMFDLTEFVRDLK